MPNHSIKVHPFFASCALPQHFYSAYLNFKFQELLEHHFPLLCDLHILSTNSLREVIAKIY